MNEVHIFNHMVKYTSGSIDATLSALADPTRRAIIERLEYSNYSVLEIAKPFQITLPAISKHLKVLEKAGLIERQRKGTTHIIKLIARPMKNAAEWLNHYSIFWEGQLESFSKYLNNKRKEE